MPRRLLIRAAYRNGSFDIHGNELESMDKVAEYIADEENKDIFQTCAVGAAYYDHQLKKLHFALPYADIGFKIPPLHSPISLLETTVFRTRTMSLFHLVKRLSAHTRRLSFPIS